MSVKCTSHKSTVSTTTASEICAVNRARVYSASPSGVEVEVLEFEIDA